MPIGKRTFFFVNYEGLRHVQAGATIGYGGNNFYEPYSNANWSASVEAAPSAVPEPGSFALLGSGVLGLVGMARRKFSHV